MNKKEGWGECFGYFNSPDERLSIKTMGTGLDRLKSTSGAETREVGKLLEVRGLLGGAEGGLTGIVTWSQDGETWRYPVSGMNMNFVSDIYFSF